MSDELTAYNKLGDEYWMHQTVNHSADEYVRGIVHTNTVEGYLDLQAWHEGRLPALQRETFAPLCARKSP